MQCNRFQPLIFADDISAPGYLHPLSLPLQASEAGICMLQRCKRLFNELIQVLPNLTRFNDLDKSRRRETVWKHRVGHLLWNLISLQQ
jgi:hypothetical protein